MSVPAGVICSLHRPKCRAVSAETLRKTWALILPALEPRVCRRGFCFLGKPQNQTCNRKEYYSGAYCSGGFGPPAGLAMMIESTRSTVIAASAASLSASFLVASRSSTPQSPVCVGEGAA